MRIRATVAAVSGAVEPFPPSLSAAQADEGRSWTLEPGFSAVQPNSGDKGRQAFGATAKAAREDHLAVVNAGRPIAVGTTAKKTVSFSATATAGVGVGGVAMFIWTGKSIDDKDSLGFGANGKSLSCKVVSATTTTCKGTITLDPSAMINSDATSWRVGAAAVTEEGEEFDRSRSPRSASSASRS
ncbi:Calcium-binding protein OS=Streptomyces cyaneofuscatus OX=66883 GN=G3I52_20125 PE=4 SV=1 [Streptomyces cyaneofuscatus]